MTNQQKLSIGIGLLFCYHQVIILRQLQKLRHAQVVQFKVNQWTHEQIAAMIEYLDSIEDNPASGGE